jgi:predicted nucleic acid-binding protein
LSEVAYIDASAFVKLFAAEPESAAIANAIDTELSNLVASEILAVEISRAAVRVGGDAPVVASQLLRRVALLPLSTEVREQACQVGPPLLRTLDAIHLATAISVRERIGVVLTYDSRLAEACATASLKPLAPA